MSDERNEFEGGVTERSAGAAPAVAGTGPVAWSDWTRVVRSPATAWNALTLVKLTTCLATMSL